MYAILFSMSLSVDAQPSSSTRKAGGTEAGERAPRGLPTILLIGFGGLLAIMVAAGFSALQTVRKLNSDEEEARHQYFTRDQVLTTVTFLVRIYDGQVERYLLSATSVGAEAPAQLARQAAEAHAAMRSYPGSQDPGEQLLLEDMERQLTKEERTVHLILSWSPEQRRRRGVELLSQELIPQRHKILEKSQQIAASNRQRLSDGLSTEFGTLQRRLTRMIFLALTTGLLLSLMSALYILRLECQARRRYQELARSRRDL